MSDLHLIDISVLPCAYVKDVIDGVWQNLRTGLESGGKVVYGFKIIGENRLIAILDGGVEASMATVTAAYGDQTRVLCTPLRPYETFSDHVLGVDKKLTGLAPQKLSTGTDGKLFWLHFVIEYEGLKTSDLVAIWAREASTVLTLRSQGNMEMEVFKVVAQREVHLFAKIRDADILDDLIFTLPIMKELGNQTHITCKSIRHLSK